MACDANACKCCGEATAEAWRTVCKVGGILLTVLSAVAILMAVAKFRVGYAMTSYRNTTCTVANMTIQEMGPTGLPVYRPVFEVSYTNAKGRLMSGMGAITNFPHDKSKSRAHAEVDASRFAIGDTSWCFNPPTVIRFAEVTPRSENTLALLGFKEEEYHDMRDDFFETLWTGIAMLLLAVPALAAVFVIPCCTRRVRALRRSMSYRELRTLDPDALIIPDTSAAASINT